MHIEYHVFARTCTCRCTISGTIPERFTPGIRYGKSLNSLSACFYERRFLPFALVHEILNDVFCLPISGGGIHQVLDRVTLKAELACAQFHNRIMLASVTGSDETGTCIEKGKGWLPARQNIKLTFILLPRIGEYIVSK